MKILSGIEEAKERFRAIRKPGWTYASAAITLDGRINSLRKPLGGPTDREWYHFLLEEAEAIVVGAETFRGSARRDTTAYQNKDIVVLSRSLRLEPELFRGGSYTIYTPSQDRPDLGRNVRIRPLLSARNIRQDLGMQKVLVDGGGTAYTLFGETVDDWFLTLVPRFSGSSQTALWESDESPELRPAWMLEADDRMLCRFKRKF